MNPGRNFFYLLSFIEGACVMAAELMGAKMMAPFYGSSLYVWASVMAITLAGLASGYFVGGIFSSKNNHKKKLYWCLLLAGVFTIFMPFSAKISFWIFGALSLIPAVIITSLVVLFPPVFLMGMVSPLIIRNITSDAEKAGRVSGTVYAVSTVGGIIATFLFGFYIIPFVGLAVPSVVTGIALGILPCIMLMKEKSFNSALFIVVAVWGIFTSFSKPAESTIHVLYHSEGLLGQVYVLEYPNEYYYPGDSLKKGTYSRWLYVNRVSQTMDDPSANRSKGEERYFTYVYKIEQASDSLLFSGRNKALLLGLGGGSVAKHLSQKGWEVDVCELDRRIAEVARNFFDLPDEVNITIDDARHFINLNKKKYDMVVFDIFKGEETPSHVLTIESLEKVKTFLNPGAMVFLNNFGYIEGEKGRGMRSIYRTLNESGFEVKILPTEKDENQRNLLFICSNGYRISENKNFYLPDENILDDAILLTDEQPCFEVINAAASLAWRNMAIRQMRQDQFERELPVFN